MSKQKVKYADLGACMLDQSAHLIPIDHPNSILNGKWICTTAILEIHEQTMHGPIFETMNTIYTPEESDFVPDAMLDVHAICGKENPYIPKPQVEFT